MPNNTDNETELLARLGLEPIDTIAACNATHRKNSGSVRLRNVLSAIVRLRDEADVILDPRDNPGPYEIESARSRLADMGTLLAMVLR